LLAGFVNMIAGGWTGATLFADASRSCGRSGMAAGLPPTGLSVAGCGCASCRGFFHGPSGGKSGQFSLIGNRCRKVEREPRHEASQGFCPIGVKIRGRISGCDPGCRCELLCKHDRGQGMARGSVRYRRELLRHRPFRRRCGSLASGPDGLHDEAVADARRLAALVEAMNAAGN